MLGTTERRGVRVADKGVCRVCGQEKALTKAGKVWTHGICKGGGGDPRSGPNPHRSPLPTARSGEDLWDQPLTTDPPVPAVTAADPFTAVSGVVEPDVKRDQWGRYKLRHPVSGKLGPFTRATTLAKTLSDSYGLSLWGQRMTLKGAAIRSDLTSLAYRLDVKEDKDQLNRLVEQAKSAAGDKVAANLGTALHGYTEDLDRGFPVDVPDQHVRDVEAYKAAMDGSGITVVPHLIERVTMVAQYEVAGTMDRVLRLPDGTYCIGDLKGGRDLTYGWQEIAIQLALYAHGVNTAGVYDIATETWLEPGTESVPRVRTDIGIVMHVPIGTGTCTLYQVDLTEGWSMVPLCVEVRRWRKAKTLVSPFEVAQVPLWAEPEQAADAVVVREPTWKERFQAASTQGEMAELYGLAKDAVSKRELNALVVVGQRRLASLVEKTG